MLVSDVLPVICLVSVLLIITPLFGMYLATIFNNQKNFLTPFLGWLEALSYRIGGINPDEEMGWKRYAKSLIFFNLWGGVLLFLLLIFQFFLPFNPQEFQGVSLDLAFNIASSFVTNTNWQAYAGETVLSYGSQMVGLTVQNFLSAATGLSVLMAFIRGITRKNMQTIGNFWSDCVRSIVYLLLPLSILFSLVLTYEGVIQSLSPYVEATTLEGAKQFIPLGPVASQVAIKQLGSNGGGFFNANSAHPFENPTYVSNFLEMVAIFLIPIATVYAYGLVIGSKRHGMLLLGVMFSIWIVGFGIAVYSEQLVNPILKAVPIWEGKELRFGIMDSLLWMSATTAVSNGSVNLMLASLSPLAGGICLFNMMLGEAVFGGVGVGLCSMLMFVLLTIFLSGLMIGKTPEYLGKKLDKYDIQWVMIAVLVPGALILVGTSIATIVPEAISSLSSKGPHSFSELLYTFTSAAVNNGSSFAGIEANTPFYNIFLGIVMIIGRLAILIPSLALAGNFANKKITPTSVGTFSTETLLFGILLAVFLVIICALTFFPALALGPIIEHLLMLKGDGF